MYARYAPFLIVVCLRTAIVLCFLFGGLRLLGKRHINPGNVCDLAFIMALANSVQNAMTGGKGDLSIGIISSATLLGIGWMVTRLVMRSPKLEKQLFDTPTVLIVDGRIDRRHLRQEQVSETQLMKALREHEITDPDEVHLAMLEVDGTISIVPKRRCRD